MLSSRQDVLILFGDADHLVAPPERQDLRKTGVEPHALENDVEGDEIAQESLVGLGRSRLEVRVVEMTRMIERPAGLVGNGRHLTVYVEQLALVQGQALDDVLEGVRVDRLLEGLPQQILAAFGICQMTIDGENDVVRHEAFGRGKEAEIALDHAPLVVGQSIPAARSRARSAL